ncbi:hypothetical protein HMPREF9554_00777 [Treponema phagedenis F0421]|nr:hypothetical protein HMPREF9554_00777 [Treponema phagedenis F0421]
MHFIILTVLKTSKNRYYLRTKKRKLIFGIYFDLLKLKTIYGKFRERDAKICRKPIHLNNTFRRLPFYKLTCGDSKSEY